MLLSNRHPPVSRNQGNALLNIFFNILDSMALSSKYGYHFFISLNSVLRMSEIFLCRNDIEQYKFTFVTMLI